MTELKEVKDISFEEGKPRVHQEEIHKILFSREIGWQEIIYDLINTEQLNPWDVNLIVLTDKYLEKIQLLEEADFFVSSKVLLAASLLLRIKSEFLLSHYIKSIDEILFGKTDQKKAYEMERIELDEEIPLLVPKSPIPRFRKVTLQELIESLNKAIVTENRRIKKEIINTSALREAGISLPKRTISIKDKIESVFNKLTSHFTINKDHRKITFTDFAGIEKEERILTFYPLLHLDHQKRVWLHQEKAFNEIDIWLHETFFKYNPDPLEELRKEFEKELEEMSEEERAKWFSDEEEFKNILGEKEK